MKILKYLGKIAGALLTAVIIIGFLYYYTAPSLLLKKAVLPSVMMPPAGSRILIFAPHNDDETLGTGILIHRAVKAGLPLQVVLITNGDGFTTAVDEQFLTMHPSSREYREFGRQRQAESVQALKLLGLSEKDIIFLGYPDGGVAHLWTEFWDPDRRYFSKYTQTDVSPYLNSFARFEPYTGVSLLRNLEQVLRDFRPTHVYFPHLNDRHPDHWAVNAFVKYALEELKLDRVREYLYLVHRGNWPKPRLPRPAELLFPPEKLTRSDTRWEQLIFKPEEAQLKKEAIGQYASQVRVMSGFLFAFVRRAELFGQYPDVPVQKLQAGETYGPAAEKPEIEVVKDPVQDFLTGDIDRAADLKGISSYLENGRWVIELSAAEPIKGNVTYRLHARLFSTNGEGRRFDINYVRGKATFRVYAENSLQQIPGTKNETVEGRWRVTIPISEVKDIKAVFLNADSAIGHFTVDKTAWRMLRFGH